MAIRTTKLGGTDFSTETLTSDDLNDTFGATLFEQKGVNNTGISAAATSNGTTSDSDTITASIPAGVVTKYILIKAYVYGSASSVNAGANSHSASCNYRVYKTYSAVDTDLLAAQTIASSSVSGGGDLNRERDNNYVFVDYYYEPTTDERTNGFDIKIDINAVASGSSSGGSSSISVDYINVMGV